MVQKPAWYWACFAMCLQVAVLLQPLLPVAWQISPVCDSISQLSVQGKDHSHQHHASTGQTVLSKLQLSTPTQNVDQFLSQDIHDHHAADHQCLYCKVYGHVLPMFRFDVVLVADRVQFRLLLWQQRYIQHYFALQRLYLTPQGRAPPFSSMF